VFDAITRPDVPAPHIATIGALARLKFSGLTNAGTAAGTGRHGLTPREQFRRRARVLLASTLILLRDGPDGVEVLMVR
jgi:hypothetical protein